MREVEALQGEIAALEETIYDIIPKKLLKQLIDLLQSLKLVGLWHYLIISLAIAVALFLIYIFYKKLFSREKLLEHRIARGECQQCGKHLPGDSPACPFCGFVQFKVCPHCQQRMHVHGKYCRECGESADKERCHDLDSEQPGIDFQRDCHHRPAGGNGLVFWHEEE